MSGTAPVWRWGRHFGATVMALIGLTVASLLAPPPAAAAAAVVGLRVVAGGSDGSAFGVAGCDVAGGDEYCVAESVSVDGVRRRGHAGLLVFFGWFCLQAFQRSASRTQRRQLRA